MSSYDTIFKKKQLIIGLGVILGCSSVELHAAPGLESTAQVTSSDQAKVVKKAKNKKSAKLIKQTQQATTPSQTSPALQEQQPTAPAQVKPTNSGKQVEESDPDAPVIKTLKVEELGEISVKAGRSKNLLGQTGSASQGVISQEQIQFRASSRPGELVELIPGMIATQHSGSGKANQYFLRGYNLDHGTDFTTIVDGIPMNMPSHAHGQGYMDLNSLIPELVDKIEYGKGPYYAEIGDFSSAGFNKMTTTKTLPQGFLKFTGGEFDFYRTVAANSSKLGDGNLLYGAEFQTYNGAWAVPENGHKYNGILRYTQDHDNWGVAVNAKAYSNAWTATNQIAQTAIDSGQLGLYGSLSPSDGGNTNRYSFSTNVWNKGQDWKNDANVYAVYYDLNLYSNFSGYTSGPWGDQMNQREHRVQVGGNEELTHYDQLFGLDMDNTYGMSFRHDEIMGLGLYNTVNRQLLNTISLDNVSESTGGLYFKNQIHWNEKFRTIQALRADFITMQVEALANPFTTGNAAIAQMDASSTSAYSSAVSAGEITLANATTSAAINAANSGYRSKEMISPKFSAILGPWYNTEYFLNAGSGYHSNDARGTTLQITPDGNAAGSSGMVTPMAWQRGGEIGARSNIIPNLNSTLALWWLQSSQELVFAGDEGATNVNGKSERYGLEFTNYYKPTDWLTLDFDLAKSYGHFVNTPQTDYSNGTPSCPTASATAACTGNYIPNLVGTVIAAGIQVVAPNGMYGSLRLRHFGDSPLDSNGTFWTSNVDILNLGLGYKQKNYKLDFNIFNLLGETTSDIAYAYNYASTAGAGAQTGTFGIVRHPVEPRMARAGITIYF
ncbi:TonB-dependent receptor plug domain-containing protein [Methylomonas sp. AM2-LC]|uniref:TonB-dependent receptor n=1 Tax=Methylomonas sp. AM2-LC TaxID=3153301 RepID=UPI003265A0E5